MDDESLLKAVFVNNAHRLFPVVLFFMFLVPSLYQAQNVSPTVSEPVLSVRMRVEGMPPAAKAKPAEVSAMRTRTPLQLNLTRKEESLFRPIIHQAAERYQVDPALVKAIILAESGYNPRAVSKKGAMGLMQLMPGTAEELGVKDGFNPEHNIHGGVRYFKKLLNHFNDDVRLALAAYNAGISNVRKHQGVPPYKATQYYVSKVFEYYQHYKRQTGVAGKKA